MSSPSEKKISRIKQREDEKTKLKKRADRKLEIANKMKDTHTDIIPFHCSFLISFSQFCPTDVVTLNTIDGCCIIVIIIILLLYNNANNNDNKWQLSKETSVRTLHYYYCYNYICHRAGIRFWNALRQRCRKG